MKNSTIVMLAMLAILAAPLRSAAQDVASPPAKGPADVVTFIDVSPAAESAAVSALQKYRDAARKEPPNKALDIYRERGQTNRFMILEVWPEHSDLVSHAKGAAARRLMDALKPIQLAPPDIREHRGFLIGTHASNTAGDAVYVMTHLDVAPPAFAALQTPLKAYVNATRRENGLMRFDVLQHVEPRQNHLTIVEEWTSDRAFNAHRVTPHARKFREQVAPLLGALYDQRLYALVE